MNRKQLRQLADVRLDEATALLKAGRSSGAYYLAGYAVECALKACIARKTQMHEFPILDRVKKSHVHDLRELVGVAKLDREPSLRLKAPSFKMNWDVVKDWKVEARYAKHSRKKAEDLIHAVSDSKDGVLTWLKARW